MLLFDLHQSLMWGNGAGHLRLSWTKARQLHLNRSVSTQRDMLRLSSVTGPRNGSPRMSKRRGSRTK